MKTFLSDLKYLLIAHVSALFVTSLYRLWEYVAAHSFLTEAAKGEVLLQSGAFLRGVWFDNVIGCYILILPLVVIFLLHLFGKPLKGRLYFVWLWMLVFYALVFAVSASDIAYFQYFFKHLNSGIWNWAEHGGTTIGMVIGAASYYPAIISYFVFLGVYGWWLYPARWSKSKARSRKSKQKDIKVLGERLLVFIVGAALIGLCFFGIRGRRGYNPIKVSAAYYCQDPFLNQLGISPTFNLMQTTLDDRRPENKELHLMDTDAARKNAGQYLGRPLSYKLPASKSPFKAQPNIVLILMESMSYELLGKGQTDFLDSLRRKSICFTNCYSAGCHTNHGIFSTLYSFPALMFRNLMKGSNIPTYKGLPGVLKEEGYHTQFYMTHEAQYDNMNAFLRTNGFDDIFAQENYPKDKVANSFGVQDDYLFEFAIENLKQTPSPFFATLLTISNHPPYVIPEWFKPKSNRTEEQIVEYADHSLRLFFEKARRQPWYENTLFVLIGDHGKLCGKSENEMPKSMNHVPWLIYAPSTLAPRIVEGWTMQMDVQPTLLALLGISARQENFGQDVLSKPRPAAYYTADNVLGIRNDKNLFIYEPSSKNEWFYNLAADGTSTHATLNSQTEKVSLNAMRKYLFSMLQTAQEEIKKHE